MYSIGSRVTIVAGFFAIAEALANKKGQPTHRHHADVALFTSPVVTCLGI